MISVVKRDAVLFFLVLTALLSGLGLANLHINMANTTDVWFVFISFTLSFTLSSQTMEYFLLESERRVSIRFVPEPDKRRISLLYSWYFFGIVIGSCFATLTVFGLEYLILNIFQGFSYVLIIALSATTSFLVLWNFERKLGKKARAWQR